MWFTRIADGFRAWFPVEVAGEIRPGLVSGDFTATIINEQDSANVTVTVTESAQKPGLYRFDVPVSFLTTHGAGSYGCVVEVDTIAGPSAAPEVVAVFGCSLKVSREDVDSLAVATDAALTTSHGAGSWQTGSAPTVEQIADQVWDEASADHTTAGTMGARMNLLDALISSRLAATVEVDVVLLRKALTNRMETVPGNPGLLILYDDDAVTPLMQWELRDSLGGAIAVSTGSPARRTAGT